MATVYSNSSVLLLRGNLFLAILFFSQVCWGGSQGPNTTGTGVDDATIGTVAWSNPGNITSSDNAYAIASPVNNGVVTHYLKATNFSFSALPSDATITGIQVEVEGQAICAVGCVSENEIKLVKAGTIGSTNRSTGAMWPNSGSDVFMTYGSASDLWGDTWTSSDITNSNFGVVVSAIGSAGAGASAKVDSVRITVYYSQPVIQQGFYYEDFF